MQHKTGKAGAQGAAAAQGGLAAPQAGLCVPYSTGHTWKKQAPRGLHLFRLKEAPSSVPKLLLYPTPAWEDVSRHILLVPLRATRGIIIKNAGNRVNSLGALH